MKTKKSVSILCLTCISLVLLLPCITLLIMSVKDYRPISGLLGSSTVGLTNITAFLQRTGLLRVLKTRLP